MKSADWSRRWWRSHHVSEGQLAAVTQQLLQVLLLWSSETKSTSRTSPTGDPVLSAPKRLCRFVCCFIQFINNIYIKLWTKPICKKVIQCIICVSAIFYSPPDQIYIKAKPEVILTYFKCQQHKNWRKFMLVTWNTRCAFLLSSARILSASKAKSGCWWHVL